MTRVNFISEFTLAPKAVTSFDFFDILGKFRKALAGTLDSMSGGTLVENQGKIYFMQFVRTDGAAIDHRCRNRKNHRQKSGLVFLTLAHR